MRELEIEQLDDGCIRVSMSGVSCTVSSMHLVEDKRRQLEAALEGHGNGGLDLFAATP